MPLCELEFARPICLVLPDLFTTIPGNGRFEDSFKRLGNRLSLWVARPPSRAGCALRTSARVRDGSGKPAAAGEDLQRTARPDVRRGTPK